MLKATRTRLGSPAWLAVGLVMLIPALAEAQLFPNRTIRREKPSCASEPPFYKQVRRDYFGYYPTCWSKFPPGWGCPCPDLELEAMRRDFKEKPPSLERVAPGASKYDRDPGDDDMGRGPAPPNPDDNKVAPPSPNQSPFEMDTKPTTPLPPAPGRTTGPGSPGPGASSSNPPANMDLPSLPATSPTTSNGSTVTPGSMVTYPDEAVLASSNLSARPELGPLPSAPTPAPFTPYIGSSSVGGGTVVANDTETVVGVPLTASTTTTTTPAQAPKRKSLLSQLFSRNNTSTQNR